MELRLIYTDGTDEYVPLDGPTLREISRALLFTAESHEEMDEHREIDGMEVQ